MSVPTSLPSGLAAVFSVGGPNEFTGERGGALELAHDASLALANGTIALTFTADDVSGVNGLFSKDGKGFDEGGHLTATLRNGWIEVRQQSDSASETLRIKDVPIGAGETHHLAVSFGEGGLKVYIDGQLAAAEPEFTQGLELNTRELVIGASATHRADDDATPRNDFDGTISDVVVYDGALTNADAIALATAADPSLGAAAELSALSEDLLPAFAQLHHASDTLKVLATAYGLTHGGLPAGAATVAGGDAAETLTGGAARDAIFAGLGDDSVDGAGGDDLLQGYYGNDTLLGGSGNDVLDGGHGEDTLSGGDGDDLIVSQADGREPYVTADPDRDEGDPFGELDPATGKLYPDQPIPADDLLIGGGGADTFYFQTLINAKQRFIEEHTKDDGTIRWHKVAGENDNIHDHWVEHIGHDVILDFSKAEGDRIVIEGHTTKIAGVTHGDADGDGIVDHSVISLYSDQGRNGGAHNDDLLGDITVYGDLVTEADIETTAKPAYGIVNSIADLDEALAPVTISPDTGPIAAPTSTGTLAGTGLLSSATPVLGIAGAVEFTGERGGALELAHDASLALANGTIALTFTADDVSGVNGLFSKDGRGFDDGGHLTATLRNGWIEVRQQSDSASETLRIKDVPIGAGETHHLAVSFGEGGLKVYIDGQLAAAEPEFTQGLELNTRELVIGASATHRADDDATPRNDFDGTISDVVVYDGALTNADAIALATAADPSLGAAAELSALSEDLLPAFAQLHHASDTLKALATAYGLTHGGLPAGAATVAGGDAAETLTGGAARDAIFAGLGDDSVDGAGGDDILQGYYGNDTLLGGSGNDILDGGHGEDTLSGGDGDDLIVSQADGREPYVTADPDRDEGDPFGELDPATGKLYPDQPIPADDLLIGGGGADTFYFQTLINAKQRFIEEHTKDDGTIRWHKVAGENDNIHDHWVEHIGHDVILDFSKAEGDRIVIEGHTTKIAGVTHGDADGDGIVDHSVIALYSDQGRNGGAHNDDLLGDITVYGDLVTEADIETTAKPAYGIVNSIADLDEALAPVTVSADTGPIAAPGSTGTLAGADLLGDAEIVFGVDGAVAFTGDRDGALAIDHTSDLALGAGTISFSFEANSITGRDALFSKDAKTKLDGGHTTAFVEADGDLKVRLQSATDQVWLKADGAVAAGQDHHVAVTFGADGAQLYLDGTLVDTETAFTQDWVPNQEVLLIGANGWASPSGEIGRPSHAFDGEIRDFAVVNAQLDATQIAGLYQAHIDDWF